MNRIDFYSARDPCGEFSNFAKFRIWLKEKYWPTSRLGALLMQVRQEFRASAAQ